MHAETERLWHDVTLNEERLKGGDAYDCRIIEEHCTTVNEKVIKRRKESETQKNQKNC